MKKINTVSKSASRKLVLRSEAIATLEPDQLTKAVGGNKPIITGSVFQGCTLLPPGG